jgi:hypothetical protein
VGVAGAPPDRPGKEWLELLKQTILSIWHDELGQVSDIRETVQKRITQIRARLRRLDEAFLYQSSIDRTTYEEQRDKLREELTLAELELSEARVEQFDIDSALAKAISVLNNASALWIDARDFSARSLITPLPRPAVVPPDRATLPQQPPRVAPPTPKRPPA